MTSRVAAASLLGAPVAVGSDRVGQVTGAFTDSEFERVLGLEVTTPEGRAQFLPWVAVSTDTDTVTVTAASALVLIDLSELDGYTHNGARVHRDRGSLASVLIGPDGSIEPGGGEATVSGVLASGMTMG